MEVTMFHPNDPKNKVVVTNDQQYAGYKKMGFQDAPENEQKDAADNVSQSPQEDAREHVEVAPSASEKDAKSAKTTKNVEPKQSGTTKETK